MEVKYISDLYEAGKIYFQSRGIAWFSVEAINRVIKFLDSYKEFVDSSVMDNVGILRGLKFASTGRETGYILKFLWYIGFLSCRYCRGRFYYKLNTVGWKYYRLYCRDERRAFIYLYRIITSRWEPLLKILEYLKSRKYASAKEIERDLGGEMEYWTSIMAKFGFRIRSVKKPYNSFVIGQMFIPLMREFGLIEGGRKCRITDEGKNVLNERRDSYDVIRTRPNEPLIYAAICNILLAREPVLISPWIDLKTAQNIVKGIMYGINKYTEIRSLRIVIGSLESKTREAIKILTELKDRIEIEIRYVKRREISLHAKTYSNEEKAIVSSANLLYRSLWKNFELGIYLYQIPSILQQAMEEIWQQAQPYRLNSLI